jgi:hypothetical protein
MGTRKTAADIRREQHADALNGSLVGTGISVVGGGSKGPYTVTVSRVNKGDVARLVEAIARELDRKPAP